MFGRGRGRGGRSFGNASSFSSSTGHGMRQENREESNQWAKAMASEYFMMIGRELWVQERLSYLTDDEFARVYDAGPDNCYIDDPEGPSTSNSSGGYFVGMSKALRSFQQPKAANSTIQSTTQHNEKNSDSEASASQRHSEKNNENEAPTTQQQNEKDDVSEAMNAPFHDENDDDI